MSFSIQFFGAAEQVTGSLYVLRTDQHTVLLECGLVQGSRKSESQNFAEFPVAIDDIDAVVISHAHIDHSGRIPLLFKRGYEGPVYTHEATLALCEIMLPDSGYLNEKNAEWENRQRREKGLDPIEAHYTREDAEACLPLFRGIEYGDSVEIVPGLTLLLHDAGHILGSAIVELNCDDQGTKRSLVFSGDLGYAEAPVMEPPARLQHANLVVMESTYGDRLHRPFDETIAELGEVFESARASKGNILIPAFTVGRTQDLLYLMKEHELAWGLESWHVYLDSPMGIDATRTYARYRDLYGAHLFGDDGSLPALPNIVATRSTEESMTINSIKSGAIIIAGSGMCTGGRIHHHLKNNISREECHIVIVGYQADGTLGRRIVDGAGEIRLWGQDHKVRAQVHTIGGLSAHADQAGLVDWYRNFASRPPVYLVHGEERSQQPLAERLRKELRAPAEIARHGMRVDIA
ncbi:MAG TPA: MBL fold metallo-hydrolase [Woeseiaceae bacterium]|nr:MBL fold metallo-hydrolase [Woeseiaceae bacterium]